MPVVEQTVAEYLKRVQQRIADPLHPHPVVKAIMVAVEASKGGKDGNYVGVSGDADLHGGVPHLSYAAAIKKQGDSYDILEVKDVINGTTVSPDSIQRMIDAEIEMLNFDGDATPVDAAVQIMDRALSPKFKVVKLDEKDRAAAIELAKWLLAEGRLKGVPSAVFREIRSIGAAADWAAFLLRHALS